MVLSLRQWKFWQVTVKPFEIRHVGFRCPLDIRVEMLSGQVDAESGVRGAWRKRGHRWPHVTPGQGWSVAGAGCCPLKPEKEGSSVESSRDPQTEGAGRPPCWLLSGGSEPVLLASVSWLTPLHCSPRRSPGFSGDSSFS